MDPHAGPLVLVNPTAGRGRAARTRMTPPPGLPMSAMRKNELDTIGGRTRKRMAFDSVRRATQPLVHPAHSTAVSSARQNGIFFFPNIGD
jgi:hypothetical protein